MKQRPTEIFAIALVSLGLLKVTENNAIAYVGDEKQYSNSELASVLLLNASKCVALLWRNMYNLACLLSNPAFGSVSSITLSPSKS